MSEYKTGDWRRFNPEEVPIGTSSPTPVIAFARLLGKKTSDGE